MLRRARSFFPLLILPLAWGCDAPRAALGPTAEVVRIPDREVFLDTALTVLREHDFQPRSVDRAAGEAVTWPITSGQWFEFWRADSQGPYQLFESSIHTVQRIVTIRVQPATHATEAPVAGEDGEPPPASAAASSPQGAGDFQVSIEVQKRRYSAPERQLTTAVGALAIYSDKLPTEEGLRNARAAGEHWIPLGRDLLLEEHLLERILAAAHVSGS